MPRDARNVLREGRIRLTHMVESARRAVGIAGGLRRSALAEDETRLLATVKSIEVIREASTRALTPQVPESHELAPPNADS